jgi:hypothetical protein
MTVQLTGGAFQDSEGNPLAFGTLYAKLNGDAYLVPQGTVGTATSSTLVCAGQQLEYTLDANGNVSVSPPQYIWPNDQLSLALPAAVLTARAIRPQISYYDLYVEDADGLLCWGPNALILDTPSGDADFTSETIETDGSTVYSLSQAPDPDGFLFLYLNGLFLRPGGLDYTLADGNQIFLNFSPETGDQLEAVYSTDSLLVPPFSDVVPTGSGTSFTVSPTPVTGTVSLFRNGLLQTPGVDYTISGSNITLTTTIGSDNLFAVYATSTSLATFFQEVPSPAPDGSRTQFSFSQVPNPESLMLVKNGQYLVPGVDYFLSSPQTALLTVPPISSDTLYSFYSVGSFLDLSQYAPQNPA